MVDAAIRKYGPFFEKLLLWLIEGERSPFIRDTPRPLVWSKEIKNKRILKKPLMVKP